MECSAKVSLQELLAIYLMTSEQRSKIAELPVLTLFDAHGAHRQQAWLLFLAVFQHSGISLKVRLLKATKNMYAMIR
jgi:hypothetical protein